MGYVVTIDQGDYLEERGGFDWGRADCKSNATHYDTADQADQSVARLGLREQGVFRKIEDA